MTKRYFDPEHGRLVYIEKAASSEFWDEHWRNSADADAASKGPSARDCLAAVQFYLPDTSAKILEGGCGNGGPLLALHRAGYEVIGVDFAQETVANLNKNFPEVKVVEGDIRHLDFEDGSFDGYWSGGVIEHFWNGYEDILAETHRLLRPQGFAFFTFPCMSALRKVKALLGCYDLIDATMPEPDGFYQFALDPDDVARAFRRQGLEVISQRVRSGIKGFADEVPAMSDLLMKHTSIPAKLARRAVRMLEPACGHSALIIARKHA